MELVIWIVALLFVAACVLAIMGRPGGGGWRQ
jgi:hypothetical protein